MLQNICLDTIFEYNIDMNKMPKRIIDLFIKYKVYRLILLKQINSNVSNREIYESCYNIKRNDDSIDNETLIKFLNTFKDDINWDYMSSVNSVNKLVENNRIDNLLDYINWDIYSDNYCISEWLVVIFINKLDMNKIIRKQKLSERFYRLYHYILDWDIISSLDYLSDTFIDDMEDKINFSILSNRTNLSEYLIRKYKNRLDWNIISYTCKFSNELIDEMKDEINWFYFVQNRHLDDDIIIKYEKYIDFNILSLNVNISESIIRRFKDIFNFDLISIKRLSIEFMRDFKDKLNWNHISKCMYLDNECIKEFADYLNWKYISKYQVLSEDMIRCFEYDVEWDYIFTYQNLSDEFKLEYNHRL